jgi:tagatose 6-phosphate kinase
MVFRSLAIDAVNRAAVTTEGAAGKSVNVAKVLKALGERPLATGFLGGDRGEHLSALLEEQGIDQDFVWVTTRTRECITVIEESGGTQTELVEESQPVPQQAYAKLMKIVHRRVKECRAVVMSGTITPGGPANFYFDCTRLSGEAGALSVVDAQGPALIAALKAMPGLVKPNRAELAATVGRKLGTAALIKLAVRELCASGAQRVVVTAGKEPTLAYDGRNFWSIVPPRIAKVNPIGSGDAFTAGLVWRLLQGDDLGEACRWASAAGAANALTLMAGDVRSKDVMQLSKQVSVARLKG